MKATFIDYLADEIIEKFEGRLYELAVVFPNRRSGLYLQQSLQKKLGKSSWLPEILSIETAFSRWSGIKLADPLDLIFELFDIHLRLEKDPNENLAVFAPYGFQMLRDFEEVDHYLIDSAKMFSYLSEAKALELWHADGSKLSPYEEQYLHFYSMLKQYHHELSDYMAIKGLGYYGHIARSIAAKDPDELISSIGFEKVIFAGFNVLTKAEESILIKLIKAEKCLVYWDVDQYLLEKNEFGFHEGGKYLRKFFGKYPQINKQRLVSKLCHDLKEIHFIAVSSNIGQAFALSSNLNKTFQSTENMAVVLADESLLLPVLNMIPPKIDNFNVTMGMSFNQGAVFRMAYDILDAGVYKQKSGRNDVVPLEQLNGILQNEMLRVFVDGHQKHHISRLGMELASKGETLVRLKSLREVNFLKGGENGSFIERLVELLESGPDNYFSRIYELMYHLVMESGSKRNEVKARLFIQQLETFKKLVNRFVQLFEKRRVSLDFKSLLLMFVSLSRGYQLPLSGEPLRGLQIMGMLETRNLDFDNVHLLSSNEGILPPAKAHDSLIPADIRRQFELPSIQEKQAVYAFHFYHLMQHAKKVFLYYNSEPDPLGGGEMSRYMLQLKYELSKINDKLIIFEESFNFDIPPQRLSKEVRIDKSEEVLKKIKDKLNAGLSPTAISRYVSCSLKFYLTDIIGIRESDQPDGTIELNILGTVVHQSLEQLYKPFTCKVLTLNAIKEMRSLADKTLTDVFEKIYPGGISVYGYNRLAFVVAKKFIEKVLFFEEQNIIEKSATVMVLAQEIQMNQEFQLDNISFRLKGTIDRIDQFNDTLRIIDYKTGTVKLAELQVSEADDFLLAEKSKAFQLAVYQFLYKNHRKDLGFTKLESGILSLRKMGEGFLPLEYSPEMEKEGIDEIILQIIKKLVDEMMDVSVPFTQTEDLKQCQHCAFSGFCMRKHDKSRF